MFGDFVTRVICASKVKGNGVTKENREKKSSAAEAGATAAGVSGVADAYSKNVIFQSKQGHGVAAEYANHQKDLNLGKRAKHLGADNAVNGADRQVNGVLIQTKYCRTAEDSISACFDMDGNWRYVAKNKPMQIEVPAGQRSDAITVLEKRIKEGKLKKIRHHESRRCEEVCSRGTCNVGTGEEYRSFRDN